MRKTLSPHIYVALLFFGVTLLILGRMLMPGYILTLDMAWPDTLSFDWSADGLNNMAPLNALFALLGHIFPSWVVQKLMLVSLFFSLLYLPYRFLPLITTQSGRVFAGLLYALNPFVYTRLLAGQWAVLLGYALLPVVVYALVRILRRPDRRSGLLLAFVLLLLGVCSVHFLYLSVLGTILTVGVYATRALARRDRALFFALVRASALAGIVFLVVSMYWLAPAYLRHAPLEARFDASHFEGFSASGNDTIGTVQNLAVLGGFWGEGLAWRYYFVWPQEQKIFWVAVACLLALIVYGLITTLRNTHTRSAGLFLFVIGICAYILALGAWGGTLSEFNTWLYMHFPGWSGLRDSHKVAGVLALVYTVFAGVGVSHLIHRINVSAPRYKEFFVPIVFVLPVLFGMYEWNGFHGELQPTWYPSGWYEASAKLKSSPESDKALVLPWRGYFSLPFANQLIVANLTPTFFGTNRVLASKSVEVKNVYDQEVDPKYRALDSFIQNTRSLSPEELAHTLRVHNIRYLFVVINTQADNQNTWLLPNVDEGSSTDSTNDPHNAGVVRDLLQVPHETLIDSDVLLYRFLY